MGGVGEAVEKAHRDRVDAPRLKILSRAPHRFLIQRHQYIAVDVDTLRHIVNTLRQDGPGRFDPCKKIRGAWNVLTADLQYVLEPSGRQ